jgi:hypothetical protein
MIDWLDEITADCAKKLARSMNDQCGVQCPDPAGGYSLHSKFMTAGVKYRILPMLHRFPWADFLKTEEVAHYRQRGFFFALERRGAASWMRTRA